MSYSQVKQPLLEGGTAEDHDGRFNAVEAKMALL